MKYVVALCTILLFFEGCNSVNFNSITGCYDSPELAYLYINLKSDSTYFFKFSGDMLTVSQTGKWKIKGNSVVLNSYVQPNTQGSFIEKCDSSLMGGLYFSLSEGKNFISDSIEHVILTQGDSLYKLKSFSKNLFVLDKDKHIDIKKGFKISTRFYKALVIVPQNQNSNLFELSLVKNYKHFFQTNEKYKVKNGKLIYKSVIFKKIDCIN